jgi:hypothetical protein
LMGKTPKNMVPKRRPRRETTLASVTSNMVDILSRWGVPSTRAPGQGWTTRKPGTNYIGRRRGRLTKVRSTVKTALTEEVRIYLGTKKNQQRHGNVENNR